MLCYVMYEKKKKVDNKKEITSYRLSWAGPPTQDTDQTEIPLFTEHVLMSYTELHTETVFSICT